MRLGAQEEWPVGELPGQRSLQRRLSVLAQSRLNLDGHSRGLAQDALLTAAMNHHDHATAQELAPVHTTEAIRDRLTDGPRQVYLRDFVYGAIDGAVTTFAIVSGVAGAGLSSGVLLVLGLANLVADGFSMAVSAFQGIRTDEELRDHLRRLEEFHIREYPEGEREEIRQIFRLKGFDGELLEQIVEVVTQDREQWVSTMIQEEHGLTLQGPHALTAGLVTFGAFLVAGSVPLAVFVLDLLAPGVIYAPFLCSSVLTAVAFFSIGAVRSLFVHRTWFGAGLETLAAGTVAAAIAWGIGWALRGMIGTG